MDAVRLLRDQRWLVVLTCIGAGSSCASGAEREQDQSPAVTNIDERKSLAVTEQAVLERFSLERVMNQLANRADIAALPIGVTKTGRECQHLHTFYQLDDGSFLAFFDVPDMPFEFREQHDFDLHIALEVSYEHMVAMQKKGQELGMDVRGISDHGFIHSIYFRDPNGYVVELTAPLPNHAEATDPSINDARAKLDAWSRTKASTYTAR